MVKSMENGGPCPHNTHLKSLEKLDANAGGAPARMEAVLGYSEK